MISVVEAMTDKDHTPGDDGRWPLYNEDFRIFDIRTVDELYSEVAELLDKYMDAAKLPEGFIDSYNALIFAGGFLSSGDKVHKGNPQRWNWVALNQICELKNSRRWLKKQIKELEKEHKSGKK